MTTLTVTAVVWFGLGYFSGLWRTSRAQRRQQQVIHEAVDRLMAKGQERVAVSWTIAETTGRNVTVRDPDAFIEGNWLS